MNLLLREFHLAMILTDQIQEESSGRVFGQRFDRDFRQFELQSTVDRAVSHVGKKSEFIAPPPRWYLYLAG